MNSGWFRLHRQLIDSQVFADAECLKLWIWLLSKASSKQRHVGMSIGRCRKIVSIAPGQCIVGRESAALALGWHPSTFRNRLKRIEAMGMISTQVNTHWSVVSITNWLVFQTKMEQSRTAEGQPIGQPTGQSKDTNKKEKKVKNEEKVENEETQESVDASLLEWIAFWNSLKAKGLVSAGASQVPSEGVVKSWGRVKKSEELRGLLSDRQAIETKIQEQPFLLGGWFSLSKLFGGKNTDGELIVRKILDGGYAPTAKSKPSANVSAGVKFDPNKDYAHATF